MALVDSTVFSAITILEDGQIQLRRSRRIFDGTTKIAEQYHRYVLAPGDTVTQEDTRVKAIAQVLWTPEVIDAYRVNQERNRLF